MTRERTLCDLLATAADLLAHLKQFAPEDGHAEIDALTAEIANALKPNPPHISTATLDMADMARNIMGLNK